MSNEALPGSLALAFFILGLLAIAGGLWLLVKYLRHGRQKTAVSFYRRRQGVEIALVTLIFGGLLVTGGGMYYFAPHASSGLRWLVGALFFAECVGCILLQAGVTKAWRSQLSSERLEREHNQLLYGDTDRPDRD